LFIKDNGGDANFHLFSADVTSKKTLELTPCAGVRTQLVDDLEEISKTDILIAMNNRKKEIFDVYRLNVMTGKMNMIAENPGKFTSWLSDHQGKIRLASATDGVNSDIYYRKTEKSPFKKVFSTDFRTQVDPEFFTFDNKNIYALSNIGRDKVAVVEFDLEKGKEIRKLYENNEFDVGGLSYSKQRTVLVAATYTSWKRDRHFFDDRIQKVFADVVQKLPGFEVALTSLDRAEKKIIVRTYSDKSLGSFYLYSEGQLTKLADVSPWIQVDQMADMKPISYKSREGLTINGYLTLPHGYKDGTLPIIVNPHGGPWARDSWGFNPEVQFLASRGYGVLQMNFRGSTGYGREFWQSSFKQWGLKMQDDVSDGVKWLVETKVADPKRVCIYGGSYGGYAVLAGLSFTPDLYACGVDYVGVSNLLTFMKTIPPYWKPMLSMMYEMVGDPQKEEPMLKASSPVFHADRIKAPLFVAQGAKDPRVNIAESNQIVNALKTRGVDVEYLVKDNEGHGFHNEENRFDFYAKMEKFLQKHLSL
jgi:dipeptidyl aminopeptidase/acylaminoacyl peptidase